MPLYKYGNHVTLWYKIVTVLNKIELNFTRSYLQTKILFMQTYYYIFLDMLITLIFFFLLSLVLRKKNLPVTLYVEALRNENSGHFEEALITYENALMEVEKEKFQYRGSLKNKITEKLKVLHTIIEYKNSLRFVR